MRTNFAVFQDSPDENYEAAPVKSFEKRQEKKSIFNAAKSSKKICKVQDVNALNVYDFDTEVFKTSILILSQVYIFSVSITTERWTSRKNGK